LLAAHLAQQARKDQSERRPSRFSFSGAAKPDTVAAAAEAAAAAAAGLAVVATATHCTLTLGTTIGQIVRMTFDIAELNEAADQSLSRNSIDSVPQDINDADDQNPFSAAPSSLNPFDDGGDEDDKLNGIQETEGSCQEFAITVDTQLSIQRSELLALRTQAADELASPSLSDGRFRSPTSSSMPAQDCPPLRNYIAVDSVGSSQAYNGGVLRFILYRLIDAGGTSCAVYSGGSSRRRSDRCYCTLLWCRGIFSRTVCLFLL